MRRWMISPNASLPSRAKYLALAPKAAMVASAVPVGPPACSENAVNSTDGSRERGPTPI